MPLLLTLLTFAGALLVLAFVSAPVRRERGVTAVQEGLVAAPEQPDEQLSALLDQRDSALAALAELDFDRALGNLSEEDYRSLRAHYRAQAIQVLKALDVSVRGAASAPTARPVSPVEPGEAHDRSAREATAGTAGVSGQALAWIAGAIGVALLAIVVGTAALRGNAATAEDAPTLNVLHAHAAYLVPGTQVALVGHHNGLLRSTDGGGTWASVDGISGDVLAVAGTPVEAGPLFLATPEQILRSQDAGLTWEPIPTPQAAGRIQALAVGEGEPLSLYASVAGAGLFRTANTRDWELVGGLPEDVVALQPRPEPFAALYAASPSEGVLASGDEGRQWGSANGVLNGTLPTLAVRTLAVDPESGDTFTGSDGLALSGAMYAGTDLGLFKSIDGGGSWSALPLREPLVALSARSRPTPLILAVDSRGRVWRSLDRGGTWSARP